MTNRPKPTVLCILDGWGHSDVPEHNAIAAANTPNWDHFRQTYPYGVINASEGEVGLPCGQMGNSEVGHMNIGAGRVVMQDLPRIDAAIEDGTLAQNTTLNDFIAALKQSGGDCHLMGLLSDGGVHAHQTHIIALAKIVAAQGITVWLHAFLDGRDTPPKSAAGYIDDVLKALDGESNIHIATLCGRYYAMDRDQRWDRVQQAYDMLVDAKGDALTTPQDFISAPYDKYLGDEFVKPIVIGDYAGMKDGDGVLMANFRADRAREILSALLQPTFDGFDRSRVVSFAATAGMVEYSDALKPVIPAIFEPESLNNVLGDLIAKQGMKQLRIAETEKYAHVTFFMNGGREATFDGEDRILVPSPKVATYDLQPEMSAPEVTDKLVEAVKSEQYDLIIVNYANTDMVGHTGDLQAAKKAVEAVDTCIGRLSDAVLKAGGAMLITADHGNAEQMQDDSTGQQHTAHTLNLVPVILVGESFKEQQIAIREGRLADIAPTILDIMQLSKPDEMTGESLIPHDTRVQASA